VNWEALGAIGEIVGAVGVIITLAYLAVQIRQNTAMTQSSIEVESSKQLTSFAETVALDRDLQRIWDQVSDSDTTLDLEEHRQWLWLLVAFFHKAEGFWVQHQRGLLSQETWAEWERAMFGFLQNQVGRDWWNQRAVIYAPEFYDFVDRLLEKGTDYKMPSVRSWREGSDEV